MATDKEQIIASIDGSAGSLAVCEAGAWVAARLERSLLLLHTLERRQQHGADDWSGQIGLGAQSELLERMAQLDQERGKLALQYGKTLLAEAEQRVRDRGLQQVQTLLRHGNFVEALVELEGQARLMVVGKVGTATVTREELEGALLQSEGDIERDLPALGIVTEQEVLTAVARLKAEGQRVVMTNGCFDLLHPGHVTYLSQAAALADVLIVAVNEDASVTRLKGSDRPINGIDCRMSVLAGLRAVSYVVPFSEDTPARLIEAISPDVLVKGGDYAINEIAGHEHVLKSGGEVIILEFVEGFSTTATIKRISTDS